MSRLELERYFEAPDFRATLLPWRRFDFPVDWQRQFGVSGAQRLHLEVGFGDGRYTVRRAAERPDDAFVGLEISSASVQRALRKVKRSGLGNIRLLKVGAQFALRHLFAPRSLATITVNFPDPWPKERHEKHRLLQRSFFDLAASRLRAGGAILLATDHPDYLAFARAQAAASELFGLEQAEPPPAVFETKYALKWKVQGKPLYYQIFRLENKSAPVFPILERSKTMPHALLKGQLPESLAFEKQVATYADGHVILHEVARSLGGSPNPRLLVRATVDEPDLKQQVIVVAQQRSPDELIVRLEPFGDPIITKTVRGAVHAVTELLTGLENGPVLKERNY